MGANGNAELIQMGSCCACSSIRRTSPILKAPSGFWPRIINHFLGCTRFGWMRGTNKGLNEWLQQNTAIRLNVIEQPPGQTGCAVIPKRWVVERSIAWAGRHRLARKAYNRNPESSEAFLSLGSIAMLLNRLYPRCSFLIKLSYDHYGKKIKQHSRLAQSKDCVVHKQGRSSRYRI